MFRFYTYILTGFLFLISCKPKTGSRVKTEGSCVFAASDNSKTASIPLSSDENKKALLGMLEDIGRLFNEAGAVDRKELDLYQEEFRNIIVRWQIRKILVWQHTT